MKGKIAVLGDIMLDRYSYGDIERLNPENPAAPLVHRDKNREEYKLGGAANVAANVATLLERVLLLGAIGNDTAGEKVKYQADNRNIEFEPVTTPAQTIVKHRIIGANKYLLRMDDEEPIILDESHNKFIVDAVQKYEPEYLIISDYAK